MTSKFLLILGIGHVLGNFYFQTDKISEEKDKSFKGKSLLPGVISRKEKFFKCMSEFPVMNEKTILK